jgi:beta-lactamase superfamily II metal-dependent hydrolase
MRSAAARSACPTTEPRRPGRCAAGGPGSRWRESARAAGLDPENPDYAENLLKKARQKGVKSSLLGEAQIDVTDLAGSRFRSDAAIANGSTIALYAEYGGTGVLLGGDAYAPVMAASIGRLLAARGLRRLPAGAFKLAHHGSTGNVSNELLALVDTRRYLFSTSGAVFGHPDDQAVARVIATPTDGAKTLYFNYTADTIAANKAKKKRDLPDWAALAEPFRCEARFPDTDAAGVVLEL